MKNIFIILGLLVVGMVFIGCPNPNVGGDDYIIENGGNNGSENGNGGGNENGGSEIILTDNTINQFTFYVNGQEKDLTSKEVTDGIKYQLDTTYTNTKITFRIENGTLTNITPSSGYDVNFSRDGLTINFTITKN